MMCYDLCYAAQDNDLLASVRCATSAGSPAVPPAGSVVAVAGSGCGLGQTIALLNYVWMFFELAPCVHVITCGKLRICVLCGHTRCAMCAPGTALPGASPKTSPAIAGPSFPGQSA